MKKSPLFVAAIGGLSLLVMLASSVNTVSAADATAASPVSTASAAAPPPASAALQTQMRALFAKVNTKLQAGAATEKDLAPEIQEFDTILAAHKGEKTDDMAQVTLMKSMLYVQVFNEPEKALPLLKQLVQDYPSTPTGKKIADALPSLEAQVAAQAATAAIRKSLVPGAAFPDFAVKGLDGQDLSVAKFKGKVVLVDFWATWCGPCMAEMPNVIKAYNQYHDKGFEIIGISLDQADQKDKLATFLKDQKMPWPQFYDGKYWQNQLAVKYGIDAIPMNYLMDQNGKIIGSSLRGDALSAAVASALAVK